MRRYSASEKLQILNEVTRFHRSVVDTCRKYKISRKTFYAWKKTKTLLAKSAVDAKSGSLGAKVFSWEKLKPRHKKKIIKVIVFFPDLSLRKIYLKLRKLGFTFSFSSFYNLLAELGWNIPHKRLVFAQSFQSFKISREKFSKRLRLEPGARFDIANKIAKGEKNLSQLASFYSVSKKTLYKWQNRFKSASQDQRLAAMKDRFAEGKAHYKTVKPEIEQKLLDLVALHPNYSARTLTENFRTFTGKKQLSYHGVYNVLSRHNLNTFKSRQVFSSYHTPSATSWAFWSDFANNRIRSVWEKFVISKAPAPPPGLSPEKKGQGFRDFGKNIGFKLGIFFKRLLVSLQTSNREKIVKGFGVGFLSAVVLRLWISAIYVPGTSIPGLIFASIALLMGTFFLLYSFKYYFTLALVLSFSARKEKSWQSSRDEDLMAIIKTGQNKKFVFKNKSFVEKTKSFIKDIIFPRKSAETPLGLEDFKGLKIASYPFVSVQVPCYNEKRVIKRVIEACSRMDYADPKTGLPNFEILVCDDSNDVTTKLAFQAAKVINKRFKKMGLKRNLVRVLHRENRDGFKGAALANALKLMDKRTQFVAVFDADFVPYQNTLKQFIKYLKAANGYSENYTKSNIAAVQGYQWHVLNKNENWITRGVRSEYAGSYVIERSGTQLTSALKQIAGSVYMIRADVLKEIGWGRSITEDFQLTLKLYLAGYKVVYTPYVQSPAECVSTLKRLIRQRMRWAEGHSFNIKKHFAKLAGSSKLGFSEKLEVFYLSPYYLQAALFILGTLSWMLSEIIFETVLPFWSVLWGWSLVFTNMVSLPLMNSIGLFVEEAEDKDYAGIASFVILSYVVAPFQAFAAIKGFLQDKEGTWFRTPKTGAITAEVVKTSFSRLIKIVFPQGGQRQAGSLREKQITLSKNIFGPVIFGQRFAYAFAKHNGRRIIKTTMVGIMLLSFLLASYTPYVPLYKGAVGNNFSITTAHAQEKELVDTPLVKENTPQVEIRQKNSQVAPEEYYVSLVDLVIADYYKEIEKLAVSKTGEVEELPTEAELLNQAVENTLSRHDLTEISKKTTKAGKFDYFVNRDVQAVYQSDELTGYRILTKAAKGYQAYEFNLKDNRIKLLESPDGIEFLPKAESWPFFQYKNSFGLWKDYIVSAKNTIDFQFLDDQLLVKQNYQLFSVNGQNPAVEARTELKLGFDGKNYTSKLTFVLNDNNNINRVLWQTNILPGSISESQPLKSDNGQEAKLVYDNLIIDWLDFDNLADTDKSQLGVFGKDEAEVIFYPDGQKGALVIDPTLSLSTTATTTTITVANRYEAVMDEADTTDYLIFKDKVENNSTPDTTHEFAGPHINEATVDYHLRWDNNRQTTILEVTPARIKLRVKGCFDTSAGGACLTDSTNTITVTEDYTFTPEGVFVHNTTDFRDTGLSLDADSGHKGYEWLGVYADVTDAGFDDTASIIYGNGETEATTTTDGAEFANTNSYVVLPGAGSDTYQDALIGITRTGWFDDSVSGLTQEWNWDENETTAGGTTQDLITAQAQAGDTNTENIYQANWFFLLKAEDDLDTEAEREALINNIRNPDILTYTTGSQWDDGAGANSGKAGLSASPGLEFDGNDYVQITNASNLNFGASQSFSWQGWIKWKGSGANQAIYRSAPSGNDRWSIETQSTNIVRFELVSGASTESIDSTTTLNDGKWHHVAATRDGSAGTLTLYIDGKSEGTPTGTLTGSVSHTTDYYLGANNGAASYFVGALDEVAIFNDVRTASEIKDNMHIQLTGSESNIVAYWRMNENTGSTAHDETTNNNDGTITGAVWTTGYVPDYYNEAEGAYTVDMSSNRAEYDLDGGSNVSTLINNVSGISAGATSITVDSTTGFASSGIAFINGDKFSYTGTTATTFTGIPSTGELSVIGHADNSVVALANRYKPFYKLRNYRDNAEPSSITLESNQLSKGTDYNLAQKPVTTSYFAQDLTMYYPMESTTANVGSNLTNSGCSFVAGKYGQAVECNADAEDTSVSITEGTDYEKEKGTIEFWFKPEWDHDDAIEHNFFKLKYDGSNYLRFSKWPNNSLNFQWYQGGTQVRYYVTSSNYSWTAGDWVHIRLEWDDTEAVSTQQRMYLNGVEPTHNDSATDLDSSLMTAPTTLFIGNQTGVSTRELNGIIDEFKVYNSDTALTKLAEGGDTADTDEYLADDTNDQTFSFAADDAGNRGEFIYFGSDSRFQGLNVDLATPGVEGTAITFNWEYWDGTTWSSLTTTEQTTGASSFEADGNFYWTAPGDWFPYSVNGSTDLYYIRGQLEAGSYSTSPIESTILTDILLVQYLNNITSEDQTFIIVPENVWWLLALMPILPLFLKKSSKKKLKKLAKQKWQRLLPGSQTVLGKLQYLIASRLGQKYFGKSKPGMT